jgi:hypothetical protein
MLRSAIISSLFGQTDFFSLFSFRTMIEIGFGDFGDTFDTERERRRRAQEREQTEQLLRLVDELQRTGTGDTADTRIEHLRILGNGDIDREENENGERRKVMGVDDLPRESEFELIFGKQQEAEPGIKVLNGRRLADGKPVQRVQIDEKLDFLLSGVRFETLVFVLLLVGLVLLVRFRLFSRRPREDFDHLVEREVQRRLLLLRA